MPAASEASEDTRRGKTSTGTVGFSPDARPRLARSAVVRIRCRYCSLCSQITGTVGFEPTTVGLEVRRSIRAELRAHTEDKKRQHQKPCESVRPVVGSFERHRYPTNSRLRSSTRLTGCSRLESRCLGRCRPAIFDSVRAADIRSNTLVASVHMVGKVLLL